MARKPLIIALFIFTLAFIIRLLYSADFNLPLSGDAEDYDRLAASLSSGKGYVTPEGKPTSWRPPLYPFFISLMYRLAGRDYFPVRLAQSFIWSLACVIIYFMAKGIFGQKTGAIAAGFSIFYFGFIRAAALFLSETLFTFFILLAVWFVLRVKEKPSLLKLIIIGVLLGAASLTKAITLLLPGFILGLFLLSRAFTLKKSISYFLIIAAAMGLTIMPWTIRNYMVHRDFVPISNQGGITLYSSFKPPEGKILGQITNDEVTARAYRLESEAQRSKALYAETFKYIINNPGKVFKLSILKIAYFLSPFDWEIVGENGVYNFQYVFFTLFAAMGIFFALRQRIKGVDCLILPVIYFLFISVLTQGCPRYRLIAEPYLIILGAFGVSAFYLRLKNRYLASAVVLFIFFSNRLIYLNGGLVKLWARGVFQRLGLW